MKKLVFSLLIGLIFSACQNTPKSATEAPQTAPTAPAVPEVVTPEAIQATSDLLTTGVKNAEALRKQVDGLSAKVKKEKAVEIAGMYATLEGLIEKQTGMINEIKASTTPTTNSASQENGVVSGPSSAQMKEYTESTARYEQDLKAIVEALQKIK